MNLIAPKKFNTDLEILRGIAALIVVFDHLILFYDNFDPTYHFKKIYIFEPPAHFAVLLFFVLSGYVIGLNHKERLAGNKTLIYLKKRFVRIYPIYFLAILLAYLITQTHYSTGAILSNFTLTQNISYPAIFENQPAWSLNFEAIYYLLFIPVSFLNIRSGLAFAIFFIAGTVGCYLHLNPVFTSYCYGYCFWLVGLYIARNGKELTSNIKLISLTFYILSIGNLLGKAAFITALLPLIKIPVVAGKFWAQSAIPFEDLLNIPFCLVIVLFFAGRDFKYKKILFILLQPIVLFAIYYKLSHPHLGYVYVSTAYLALAFITYFIPIPETSIKKLGVKLGGISYGIYIIHFPLLMLFGKLILPHDNALLYVLRVILYLTVTLFLAWILEKKLQPILRNWMFKGKPKQA